MAGKRPADQEFAHGLLQEWAAGLRSQKAEGFGFAPAPTQKSVQNDHAAITVPEQYADEIGRWGLLQSAVGAVRDQNHFYAQLLWDHYRLGRSVQRISDLAQISQRSCYERLDKARLSFLWAYHAARGRAGLTQRRKSAS